jgi:glycolate oxidase iron-sulfur subunit
MQTTFSLAQLADPDVRESEKILRACVHCGFCTATCPTYVLLGDELDSPRGRIYLIKDMLENARPASARVVTHIDRCLSCLACMTTCPSGVHYMHLVDHARRYIEETYRRPWPDRLLRSLLAAVLPRPWLFRLALRAGRLGRPLRHLLPVRLAGMLALTPARLPAPSTVDRPQVFAAQGEWRARVALLSGCAQQVLAPRINEATIRLMTRHGVEVVIADGAGCCGALVHHMGREAEALAAARANIDAWERERADAGLDAVVINASGCGTTVKDYGFMLREDRAYAEKAARIAALARDVTELLAEVGLQPPVRASDLVVAYHSACSLQHGQRITAQPKDLLRAADYTVKDIPEGHICCGSAGTYNLLQPVLANELRERKLAHIARVRPDVVATGNIGCMVQLAGGAVPVVHTVELLDWATGGPAPGGLAAQRSRSTHGSDLERARTA